MNTNELYTEVKKLNLEDNTGKILTDFGLGQDFIFCVCLFCAFALVSFSGNPTILIACVQYLSLLLIPSLLFISLNFFKKQIIRNNFKFIIESIQR